MQNDEVIHISLSPLLRHPVAHLLHGESEEQLALAEEKTHVRCSMNASVCLGGSLPSACFQMWGVKCVLGPLQARHSALKALQLSLMFI